MRNHRRGSVRCAQEQERGAARAGRQGCGLRRRRVSGGGEACGGTSARYRLMGGECGFRPLSSGMWTGSLTVSFQTIVDVEVGAGEADESADAILAWLLETGVVPSMDCVSRNEVRTEGLVVITRRHVFYSMTGEDQVACPHCGHVTAMEYDGDGLPVGLWQEMLETIGVWYDGGPGERACPRCGRSVGLNDWDWAPPWGFGCLGFTFWDWGTQLSPEFKAEMSRRLGHRTVYPYGRL